MKSMKKTVFLSLFAALLLAFLTTAAVSCGPSGDAGAETNDAVIELPDGTVVLNGWFDYGTALYLRNEFTAGNMTDGIAFQMAKNEREGFQYILTASEDVTGLRCEVEPLSDGAGHTLAGEVNVAWYLWVQNSDATHKRGFTPCMLLPQDDPYQGGTFDVAANTARTLYVRYDTKQDTVPGTYTGRLTITKDGETKLSGDVSVRVRDIYYDEKTECLTTYGLTYDPDDPNPSVHAGPDSAPELGGGSELQRIYAQYMLDNRVTPSDLPFPNGLLSEGAVEYMKNPRVTMVHMGYSFRNTLDDQYRIAKENDLLNKFYFSFFDEPHEIVHLGEILQGSKMLNKNYPGFRAMDALICDLPWKGKNIIDSLSEVTTMYCPNASIFTGEIRDTLLRLKEERGDTLFWYSAGAWDRVYMLPCTPGTDKRLLFWQQYQQNIDGNLCWRATYWNDHDDVWAEDYLTQKHKFPDPNAMPTDEGVWLYWHPTTGLPVSTLGFESLRDGIEDFQLMKMVEAAFSREKVLSYIEQLTTDPIEYIHYEDGSTPLLENLKNQMFDLLDP